MTAHARNQSERRMLLGVMVAGTVTLATMLVLLPGPDNAGSVDCDDLTTDPIEQCTPTPEPTPTPEELTSTPEIPSPTPDDTPTPSEPPLTVPPQPSPSPTATSTPSGPPPSVTPTVTATPTPPPPTPTSTPTTPTPPPELPRTGGEHAKLIVAALAFLAAGALLTFSLNEIRR